MPWLWIAGIVLFLLAALLYFSPQRRRQRETAELRSVPFIVPTPQLSESAPPEIRTPPSEGNRETGKQVGAAPSFAPSAPSADEIARWWTTLVEGFGFSVPNTQGAGSGHAIATEHVRSTQYKPEGETVAAYPAARQRSGFHFGGQTLDFGAETAARMQAAGMQWVKFQVHVGDLDAGEKIARAHERGFRALVGLLGEPERVTDHDYATEFAAYAGEVAAADADAIEVWNEPNISRDWPVGRISPALYLNLLRPSYQAIKASNPNVLVISAGLAPTLMAENLRTDDFWTEVDYTTQLVALGGLQYLDCMGVHYNVGITAPDTSDPALRGDAAFIYYPRVLQHYARISRNTRPVCFTEFGYLTGEGLPDLRSVAPSFQWAAGTSLDEQADWLARAVDLAQNDRQVEMLVVWNVDYWSYGADPHAGYAIIRPDGSCPACESVSRVVN